MDTTNGESSQRHRQDNDIAFYSTSNNVLQDSAYPPHLYGTQSSRNARDASLAFGEPTQIDIHNAMEQYSQLSHSLGTESTDRELVELEEGVTPGKFEYLMRILNSRLEEQRSRGVIEKRLGVSFRNLTVLGNSSKVQHIQTVWSPILHAIRIAKNLAQRRLRPTPGEPVRILHNISGFCADGEMVLVLGVPGSGCSTLLRVLANRRKSYKEIHGEVSYHGISANEMAKKYRGEVAYNQEEDDHYPMVGVDAINRCWHTFVENTNQS
jgi:ATP-binding cassette subfamily G (WHITE) protein 2 (SNQ2)